MKTLYLVRHAKSSWREIGLADIDRPLKESGVLDAIKIGNWLADRDIMPELIFASNANRALHTATIFARSLKLPLDKLKIRKELYGTTKESILHFTANFENSFSSLMFVAHDPTLTNLVNHYLEKPDLYKIPTSSVVELKFETDSWLDIKTKKPYSVSQIIPKTLLTINLK